MNLNLLSFLILLFGTSQAVFSQDHFDLTPEGTHRADGNGNTFHRYSYINNQEKSEVCTQRTGSAQSGRLIKCGSVTYKFSHNKINIPTQKRNFSTLTACHQAGYIAQVKLIPLKTLAGNPKSSDLKEMLEKIFDDDLKDQLRKFSAPTNELLKISPSDYPMVIAPIYEISRPRELIQMRDFGDYTPSYYIAPSRKTSKGEGKRTKRLENERKRRERKEKERKEKERKEKERKEKERKEKERKEKERKEKERKEKERKEKERKEKERKEKERKEKERKEKNNPSEIVREIESVHCLSSSRNGNTTNRR